MQRKGPAARSIRMEGRCGERAEEADEGTLLGGHYTDALDRPVADEIQELVHGRIGRQVAEVDRAGGRRGRMGARAQRGRDGRQGVHDGCGHGDEGGRVHAVWAGGRVGGGGGAEGGVHGGEGGGGGGRRRHLRREERHGGRCSQAGFRLRVLTRWAQAMELEVAELGGGGGGGEMERRWRGEEKSGYMLRRPLARTAADPGRGVAYVPRWSMAGASRAQTP